MRRARFPPTATHIVRVSITSNTTILRERGGGVRRMEKKEREGREIHSTCDREDVTKFLHYLQVYVKNYNGICNKNNNISHQISAHSRFNHPLGHMTGHMTAHMMRKAGLEMQIPQRIATTSEMSTTSTRQRYPITTKFLGRRRKRDT